MNHHRTGAVRASAAIRTIGIFLALFAGLDGTIPTLDYGLVALHTEATKIATEIGCADLVTGGLISCRNSFLTLFTELEDVVATCMRQPDAPARVTLLIARAEQDTGFPALLSVIHDTIAAKIDRQNGSAELLGRSESPPQKKRGILGPCVQRATASGVIARSPPTTGIHDVQNTPLAIFPAFNPLVPTDCPRGTRRVSTDVGFAPASNACKTCRAAGSDGSSEITFFKAIDHPVPARLTLAILTVICFTQTFLLAIFPFFLNAIPTTGLYYLDALTGAAHLPGRTRGMTIAFLADIDLTIPTERDAHAVIA